MKGNYYLTATVCFFLFQCLFLNKGWGDRVRMEKGGSEILLSGQFKEIGEHTLLWQSPYIEEEVEIELASVLDVEIDGDTLEYEGLVVVMNNGDRWAGELVRFDEKEIVLKTTHSGEVRMDRAGVQRIKKASLATEFTYWGPRSGEEWAIERLTPKAQSMNWKYSEGALHFKKDRQKNRGNGVNRTGVRRALTFGGGVLHGPHTIKKNILPGKGSFVLTFDCYSNPVALTLRIGQHSINLDMNLSRTLQNYQRANRPEVESIFSGVRPENFEELRKEKITFLFHYDEKKRKLNVYANGKKIMGRDMYVEHTNGEYRELSLTGRNADITVRNMRIGPWNGGIVTQASNLVAKETDQIGLKNGSLIEGSIQGLREGKLMVEKGPQKSIAISEVEEIYFGGKESKRNQSQEKKVVLRLKDTTTVSVELESVNQTEIKARVDHVIGNIVLKTKDLKRMEFMGRRTAEQKGETSWDILNFNNGDRLVGKVKKMEGGKIRLKGVTFLKEVSVDREGLRRLELGERGVGSEERTTYVELTNGDLIPGEIREIKEKAVILETSYGNRLEIEGSMVENIWLTGAADPYIVYEGFGDGGEWRVPKILRWLDCGESLLKNWRYKDGALYTQSSHSIVIKRIGTPDRVLFEFDVDWVYGMSLGLSLFGELVDDGMESVEKSSRYYLNLNSGSAALTRYQVDPNDPTALAPMGFMGFGGGAKGVMPLQPRTVRIEEISQERNAQVSTAKVGLYVDKKEKLFTLTVNGNIVQTWRDPNEKETWGDVFALHGLHGQQNAFVGGFGALATARGAITGRTKLRVRNFKVTHWDGVLPGEEQKKNAVLKEDLVSFKNRDTVNGNVQHVGKERVAIRTGNLPEPIEIPRERILQITLAKEKMGRARKKMGDVRVVFRDGGSITMQLEELDEDRIKGKSQNFGEGEFSLKSVKRLEFDIYNQKIPQWRE